MCQHELQQLDADLWLQICFKIQVEPIKGFPYQIGLSTVGGGYGCIPGNVHVIRVSASVDKFFQ